MYISQPFSLTAMYVDNDSMHNKYEGLLNANFQDYMDSLQKGGELEIRSGKLKQRVSALFSGLGMAAGALGGPAGMTVGFSVGNLVGRYVGSSMAGRIYGRAMEDMGEINQESKQRHAHIAAQIAMISQMGGAIDTLRQNENKRKKDDLQGMQV